MKKINGVIKFNMMKQIKSVFIFLSAVVMCSCQNRSIQFSDVAKKSERIWYEYPAKSWMSEALPIGNGYMGAMFFGGVYEEQIQFNEESLWSGGKGEWDEYNGGNREDAHKYLPKVRQLLKEGRFDEAHVLASKELTGKIKSNKGNSVWEGYGAYQAFGEVFVKTQHSGELENYKRELNISKGIGTISYQLGDINFKREYFASYPKRALVFRFENDAPSGIDYIIRKETVHENVSISFSDNQLILNGKLQNNGMEFESRMLIETDGEVLFTNGKLKVKSAKVVTLYLTAATDYENNYPEYKGRDYKALNHKTIKKVQSTQYKEILAEHKTDFVSLHSRVALELGHTNKDDIPTNERLKTYAEGQSDQSLEALFFQYGRYLIISSSRPRSMPANLQGKWNNVTNPPWAADYHANINIQMIYWPVEVTNLSECHEPLIEYVDNLRAPGSKTAKDFFNTRGWVVNTMNNTFGFTAPGWGFPWGFFPGGAAWYGRHVWEHYEFTQDKNFLKDKGYTIMKEAALFWLDYLTEDEEKWLVSSPSYSPEHGGISTGAYMDIQIAWDIFTNCIKACEVLDADHEFKKELIEAKSNLLPLKIGKWGQLQEWKEDRDDPNNKHRHVSHLFALYPSDQVNLKDTPELSEAAKVSLIARGDEGTGWSIGWKINFWSRLLDGDHAYKLLRRAIKVTEDEGTNMMDGGGIYSNMLSAHPPFQLDGNMGATSGIAEMLIQSHAGEIHVLPALPKAWLEGKITGLKARKGFEIDIEWKDGELTLLKIKSLSGNRINVKYRDKSTVINLKKGEVIRLDRKLKLIE